MFDCSLQVAGVREKIVISKVSRQIMEEEEEIAGFLVALKTLGLEEAEMENRMLEEKYQRENATMIQASWRSHRDQSKYLKKLMEKRMQKIEASVQKMYEANKNLNSACLMYKS